MIVYFDCSSGISGDMTLGALVDAGVPIKKLAEELARLPLKGYELKVRKVLKSGLRATKVDVIIKPELKTHKSKARKWKDIEKIIKTSTLAGGIKQKGLKIFRRLFDAEAMVHGSTYDSVHLHELGAVDCIVDIFGTLIGLDILGITSVYSSPLNLGSGIVKTEHGILPVPAPATLELLRNKPVYSSGILFELTTPTGAVLISTLAEAYGQLPDMTISKIGIGAGDKDFKDSPNILRLIIGEATGSLKDRGPQTEELVSVIETDIDDMNPQIYEHVMDLLFQSGALDVSLIQTIMKKGRPGIRLTVLCSKDKRDAIMDVILRETTSIGLRYYTAARKTLKREIITKKTRYGNIKVKVSQLDKKNHKVSFEYEDCRKIAREFNIPLIEVLKTLS